MALAQNTTTTRTTKVLYRGATGLAAFVFAVGGAADLMRLPSVTTSLQHLGYPMYLLTILGVWKPARRRRDRGPRTLAIKGVGLRGNVLRSDRSGHLARCLWPFDGTHPGAAAAARGRDDFLVLATGSRHEGPG